MDCVVSPVDQRFPTVEDEVNSTDSPSQKVVGPLAVIVGTGGRGLTFTVTAADGPDVHPKTMCSTVNDPAVVTVIDCVVSPVDHKFPLAVDDVRITEPPSQKVVKLPAVTTGVVGIGFTVTLIVFETAEVHGPSTTVTE